MGPEVFDAGNPRDRKRWAALVLSAWICAAGAQTRAPQEPTAAGAFPQRPLRAIVPVAAGGGHDLVARIVAGRLSETLGQQVVIDNRAGGGGSVGATLVARAAPDGYTLLVGSISTHALNPALFGKLTYDSQRDFAPISLIGAVPNVLVVHPSLPVTNVAEFIAHARAHPGKINYGSAGVGVSSHLAMELLKTTAGIDVVHVPYKGAGPALADLLAGQVQVMCTSLAGQIAYIRAGRVRAIAVTSARRNAQLPDVPTVIESGLPGFEVGIWFAMFAPAGTARPVVARLHADTVRVVTAPDVRERMAQNGVEAQHSTPEELAAFARSELARWTKVVKASGMKVD